MTIKTIVLTPSEFSKFVEMTNRKTPIGDRLRKAARRLDEQK